MPDPVIVLDHVSKRYVLHHVRARSFQEVLVDVLQRRDRRTEAFWAVRDASFEVQPGESVGLIGPNGSGKSTTLKLIARIIEPTTGRISARGRIGALLELGAGFHPDLTGRENIFLSGSILGLSRAQVHKHLDSIIAFADIGQFVDVPVRLYSSGMFVRLGFAVAVHLDTEILLIDEVLAVGDARFQRRCMDLLATLHSQGKTFIIVSHDFNAIQQLCSRVIEFEQGRIKRQGTADQVIHAMSQESMAEAHGAASSVELVGGLPLRLRLAKSELTGPAQAALGGGWYDPEDTHCWTTRRAQLGLFVPAEASHLYLELASMRTRDGDRPLTLTVTFDEGEPETIYLIHPYWQVVRADLPQQARGRPVTISIEAERTMVPDLYHHNRDMRELGVAVSRVWTE